MEQKGGGMNASKKKENGVKRRREREKSTWFDTAGSRARRVDFRKGCGSRSVGDNIDRVVAPIAKRMNDQKKTTKRLREEFQRNLTNQHFTYLLCFRIPQPNESPRAKDSNWRPGGEV
jgi:hypothetical protein